MCGDLGEGVVELDRIFVDTVLKDAAEAQADELHSFVPVRRAVGKRRIGAKTRPYRCRPRRPRDHDRERREPEIRKVREQLREPRGDRRAATPLAAESAIAGKREHRIVGELGDERRDVLRSVQLRKTATYEAAHDRVIHTARYCNGLLFKCLRIENVDESRPSLPCLVAP